MPDTLSVNTAQVGKIEMRVINGIFCILLVLFAAVQYNDPDRVFWGGLYLARAN